MKYKMAVFDLDGTLLNTLEDLADAVNYSLAQFGMPQRTIEEVRNYVGNGIRLLIERSVPNGTDLPVIDNVFECFKKYYQEHCNDKTKAYDGIIDMLKELKQSGIKLAVLSNKAQNAVTKLCDIYFDNLLDITFGAREGIAKKPAPDALLECAAIADIAVEDILRFESELFEYIDTKYPEIPEAIINTKVIDEETEAKLVKAIEECKAAFK